MKKLLVMGALWLVGCDFREALRVCHETGGCTRDGGEVDAGAPDAGGPDAGGTDAGPVDGGGTLFSTAPIFFTSGGWGWEFPFPAGPGLHSVAAISDQEAWAAGDDDSVLHYLNGVVTFSRAGSGGSRVPGGVVVKRADGGVVVASNAGGPPRAFVPNGSSWAASSFPMNPASGELGDDGVEWFGGQWQPNSGPCGASGAAVLEGLGATPFCVARDGGNGYVIGLDPRGWALDNQGNVLRRTVDGGVAWSIALENVPGYFPSGDVLALSNDDLLVVGVNTGSSSVVSLDGGVTSVVFAPMGAPEVWTSLVRAPGQQRFLIGGKPGVQRCELAVPLSAATCAFELQDPSQSLEALSAGPSLVYGVGDNGQLVRGDSAGGWTTLHSGGVGSIYDVWGEPSGELWAVSHDAVLHRTDLGWARIPVAAGSGLQSITKTSDGLFWVVGASISTFDPGTGDLNPAEIVEEDGGNASLAGVEFYRVTGTEPGNTWAVGLRMARYVGANTWVIVPLPANRGTQMQDVWVSDAGTAWAVGGATGLAMFWDGTRWADRTPAGVGNLDGVWGVSSTEVFVTGKNPGVGQQGYHFLRDGGVEPWNLGNADRLVGGLSRDGGFVLYGGAGTSVWRSANGSGERELAINPPAGRYLNALRLIDGKLFVAGSRRDAPEDDRSYVLSFDAGL